MKGVCRDVVTDSVSDPVRGGIISFSQERNHFVRCALEQNIGDTKATISMICHMPQCLITDRASICTTDPVQCNVDKKEPVSRISRHRIGYDRSNQLLKRAEMRQTGQRIALRRLFEFIRTSKNVTD